MADARPLPAFDSAGQQWANWKEKFVSYLHTRSVKDPERKLSYLKFLGGDEIIYLLKNARASYDNMENDDVYLAAMSLLDDHFKTVDNPFVEIEKFRSMKQATGEPAKNYVVRLRQQAMKCNFSQMEEEVRRQFVLGNADEKLKAKAFRKELELSELITEATANESMMKRSSVEINFVREKNFGSKGKRVCWFCKKSGHFIRSCPRVKEHTCTECGKKGHTERRCYAGRSKQRSEPYPTNRKFSSINCVNEEDEPTQKKCESSVEQEYVFFLDGQDEVNCSVGGVRIRMIVDNGVTSNIISAPTWESLKANSVKTLSQNAKCSKIFRAFGSPEPIPVLGTFEAEIRWRENKELARFYVLARGDHSLLGRVTAKVLGILDVKSDVRFQ